jgi:sugar phosphate isomerase/epimerase
MTKLTRRDTLATALGLVGAAVFGGSPSRAEPPEPLPGKTAMKIGCGTVVFRQRPLAEALHRIRRAGYEYVETQATGPWCPHVDPWKDDPQAFRRLVGELGFKGVTGLWSAHGAIVATKRSVEGITQSIRWAKQAGIPVVHSGDGVKPDAMSEEDALALLRDRLAKILEVAEECQVCLAIEPHGTFSMTADGLRKIMGLSNSKWLGINYDTANVHTATYPATAPGAIPWKFFGRRQDEVATLAAVADRVRHVHVKDLAGAKCVALGEGTVNLGGCIRILKQHGYAGVLSLETEGDLDAEPAQRLIGLSRAYLKGALGVLDQ